MTDLHDPAALWTVMPVGRCAQQAWEDLFEFVRVSDRQPMRCVLRFNGEGYGWEVIFYEQRALFCGLGGFLTRAAAVECACLHRDMWSHREE